MVQDQIMMAQVDTANQLTQLLAASGSETFKVGQIASATNAGGGGMITLTPSAGGDVVAAKIESARQMADVSTLVGKTVAVSKPSMMAGAGVTNNWLMMQPVHAGATSKLVGSSATMLKLEGTRQGAQAAALMGQNFTVVKPMMAGKTAASTLFLQPAGGGDLVALKMANATPAASSLVGKTVTIGQAPMVAGGNNAGTWLVLKPSAAATAAKSASGVAAAKVAAPAAVAKTQGVVAAAPVAVTPVAQAGTGAVAGGVPTWDGGVVQAKTVAMVQANADVVVAPMAKGAMAAKAAPVAGAVGNAKMVTVAATTGGTTASKAGLGLGLGLGVWGTALVGVLGVTAAYGYYRSRKIEGELSAEEQAQSEQTVVAE
ncbi:MAG: hypothetical protein HOL04_09345 [Gammaproteobacteria bacterium]|nr:hypothetical protein [Gammaproteobacteria bacterium]MBT4605976.1 hypothetical protein [Thiotrichales bacterium]MBT3472569.1 hypothetical protein [Gammaproteobacteria bacterium]MBT3967985.1 hypothetical protein [Gammaproteobacteria bacterium]MBT4079382.1 hypothetical protein [Gammaproteobacteria bacterium]